MASLKEMRSELQTIAKDLFVVGKYTSEKTWRPTIKLSKSLATEAGDFDTYKLTYNVIDRAQRRAVREWLAKHGLAIQYVEVVGSRWNQFYVLELWPANEVSDPNRGAHLLRYPGEE